MTHLILVFLATEDGGERDQGHTLAESTLSRNIRKTKNIDKIKYIKLKVVIPRTNKYQDFQETKIKKKSATYVPFTKKKKRKIDRENKALVNIPLAGQKETFFREMDPLTLLRTVMNKTKEDLDKT